MYRSPITTAQWRTIFAVVAGVVSFLLATDLHPDVVLGPIPSLILGCIMVAIAAMRPGGDAPSGG
jgi:hypothetical protein